MNETDDQIKPRTKSERVAYVEGYAEAINIINKNGIAAAVDWLRSMAELDGLIERPNGKD
jgi:hypothetical protein